MIRGLITSVVEGAIKRFSASGRADEEINDREMFQHYGFTSRALPSAETIIINDGNLYFSVAEDDRRYRIEIEEGEVALYDDLDQVVHLTRDGIVASSPTKITAEAPEIIATASTSCQVNSPFINLGGNRGDLRYLIDERIISWLTGHTHSGVQGGSATSGGPVQSLSISNVGTTITKAG